MQGVPRGYEANPLFAVTTAFGAVGLVLLLVGAALFVYFEPPGAGSSTASGVTLTAVRSYDPHTGTVGGADQRRFKPDQIPAAVVDWSRVDPSLEVRAAWYSDDTAEVAGTGPQRAGSMPRDLPLTTDAGSGIPAGTYVFVVGRFEGGRIVQVLQRTTVEVGP